MPSPAPSDLLQEILGMVVLFGIIGCISVWATIAMRWHEGHPVLPYHPRRRVPWRAFDTMILVLLYLCMPQFVVLASKTVANVPVIVKAECANVAPMDDSHPLARILQDSRNPWVIVLCLFSAVIIAPISEELVFRLVLQGWLESLERRIRRRIPLLRRLMAGLVPVATVAGLFAAMHIRTPSARMELSEVVFLLSTFSAAHVLTVVILLCWLKFVAGATLADLGIVPGKVVNDILLGLLAFLAFTPPVYAVMISLKIFVPEISVPDPIPILILGMAFGGLYYRTHRIVPSMVMHAAFNAVGVLVAIAMAK